MTLQKFQFTFHIFLHRRFEHEQFSLHYYQITGILGSLQCGEGEVMRLGGPTKIEPETPIECFFSTLHRPEKIAKLTKQILRSPKFGPTRRRAKKMRNDVKAPVFKNSCCANNKNMQTIFVGVQRNFWRWNLFQNEKNQKKSQNLLSKFKN